MAKPVPSFAEQIAAAGGVPKKSRSQELTDKFLGWWNFDQRIRTFPLPEPVREYRFHPVRLWRFDLAWIDHKLAVEFNGGVWIDGGHNRGRHQQGDFDKFNEAQLLGWRVLQFGTNHVKDGQIADVLRTVEHALSPEEPMSEIALTNAHAVEIESLRKELEDRDGVLGSVNDLRRAINAASGLIDREEIQHPRR